MHGRHYRGQSIRLSLTTAGGNAGGVLYDNGRPKRRPFFRVADAPGPTSPAPWHSGTLGTLPSVSEALRLSPRDGERAPARARVVLREQHDLSCVPCVMGGLPVDGLRHGVRLTADADRAVEVLGGQRRQRLEHERPPRFPGSLHGLRRIISLE